MAGSTFTRLHQTILQAPAGGSLPVNNGSGGGTLSFTGAATGQAGWFSPVTVVSHKSDAWARINASTTVSLTGMSIAENDEVVVIVGTSGTSIDRGVGIQSGWSTLFSPNLIFDDTNDVNFLVARKRMGSTPDTSVDITSSNPTSSGVGSTTVVVVVLRGVDSTSFLDVAVGQAGSADSSTPDPASITSVTDGVFYLVAATAAVSSLTGVTLVPGAELTQLETVSGFAGQSQLAVTTVGYKNINATGAYDPPAWVYNVSGVPNNITTSSWASATIAVKPGVSNTVRNGVGAVSLPLSVSGTGQAIVVGSLGSSLAYTLSAQGKAVATGTGVGSLPFSLAAQGGIVVVGQGAFSISYSLVGTGSTVTPAIGSGAGTLDFSFAAVGSAPAKGQLVSSISYSLEASGTSVTLPVTGTLDNQVLNFSLIGAGQAVVQGFADVGLSFGLAGTGKRYDAVIVAKITRDGLWKIRLADGIFSDAEKPGSWVSRERAAEWL